MTEIRHRKTARAVIYKDGKILIMERWRRTSTGEIINYYSIPGGGIEDGETGEQAVARELKEEMGVIIEPLRFIVDQPQPDGCHHYYYWCRYITGEPALQLDSEEAMHSHATNNRFEPKWMKVESVRADNVQFEYAPLVKHLAYIVQSNGHMPADATNKV